MRPALTPDDACPDLPCSQLAHGERIPLHGQTDPRIAPRECRAQTDILTDSSSQGLSTIGSLLLLVTSAQVVLAVPEEGYDTSLVVEALALGALVVLERGAGLERALHALPVLLVDDFGEVTAALLKEAYAEALYHAEHWDFRRITKQWYEGLIFAVAEDSSTGPLLALHPVDRDDTLFRRPSVHFDCRAIGGCGSGTARVPRRRRCLGPRT